MAKPAIYPPEPMIEALERMAQTENERRGEHARPLTWQDIGRSILAAACGLPDATPGGLDVARLRSDVGLPPLAWGKVESEPEPPPPSSPRKARASRGARTSSRPASPGKRRAGQGHKASAEQPAA